MMPAVLLAFASTLQQTMLEWPHAPDRGRRLRALSVLRLLYRASAYADPWKSWGSAQLRPVAGLYEGEESKMYLSICRRLILSLACAGFVVAGLFLLLTGAPRITYADVEDVFVTPSGGGDCSQADPCDLQTGLSMAADGGDVYLAQGTYTGVGRAVVTLTQSVALYGGWDGTTSTPPACDPDRFITAIDGESTRRGVAIEGPVTVTLEGLTIAYGQILSTTAAPWDGAGLYAQETDLTLRHMAFYSNVVDVYDVDDSQAYGGGAAVEGGSLLVEASVFRWNSARGKKSSYGGGLSISHGHNVAVTSSQFRDNDAWHASGLYLRGESNERTPFTLSQSGFVDNGRGNSNGAQSGGYAGAIRVGFARAHIEDNTFLHSRAANDYGAVYVASSSLSLARNLISGSISGRTSGLHLHGVSPLTVTNNIIAGNRSAYSWLDNPAVRVINSNGQFIHNTVAQNESTYGFQVDSGATVMLTNTLLVSHTVGISVTEGSVASLEGTLWGNGNWANGTDWGGAGDVFIGTVNVWGDPAFVNPDGGDYHIGPGSAGRDQGVATDVETDIDGELRLDAPDIGADEFRVRWDIFLPMVVNTYPPVQQ
jgi:hypothetical protein